MAHWIADINFSHVFALLLYVSMYGWPRIFARPRQKLRFTGSLFERRGTESSNDQCLAQRVPESTPEERTRFLVAKNGNVSVAAKYLIGYLEWRTAHDVDSEKCVSDSEDNDLNDWNRACAVAMKACNSIQEVALPRVIRIYQRSDWNNITDVDGFRVFHILPGLIDNNLVSLETYALAIALYIDIKLDRRSMERVTVIVDVRGGLGWRNLNARQLLPFIKHTSRLLLTMFPERLARAIVYPVPPTFSWIWKIIRRCIDPKTREKICLLTGPATIISPPPNASMAQYLDHDVIALLESRRVEAFAETANSLQ